MRESARFITYGAVVAAAVGIFACSGVSAFLDDHFLLENTHAAYYENYGEASIKIIPADVADNGIINQVVNNLATWEYDQGFRITVYEDGAITYSGTNESEDTAYITITTSRWDLEDGIYILTDSSDGLNGPVVSGDGISLYAQGRNYKVGGETEYLPLADMSDLSTIIFVADHAQYTDYSVALRIAPGYTSEGITFYPMVTRYEDRPDAYRPCRLTNRQSVIAANEKAAASAESEHIIETAQYDYYAVDKSDYLAMSEDDLTLLDRRIQYQHSGRWSTIAFGDGTGIYYPDNDPTLAEYGELNAIGQVELLYGGLDQIMLIERPLAQTTVFSDYLQLLNNPDYTILLAVRDDGVSALTESMMTDLQELGVQTPLLGTSVDSYGSRSKTYYRNSYYAVLNPGAEAIEAAGEEALTYSGKTRDGNTTFTIHSAGYLTGAADASIVINGEECSMNRRGMNIVVYDNTTGEVVDQVTFDTCSGLQAYRTHETAQD